MSWKTKINERKCKSLMNTLTQDMKARQSLVEYAKKNGVRRTVRKYGRCSSYIYFWLHRYDGTLQSLAKRSTRPKSHPNQHTAEELQLIQNILKRNPNIGLTSLWCRLRRRNYTRTCSSLYRVLVKQGKFRKRKDKPKYTPKPYQQMTHPGERIQIDVKVVPHKCCVRSGKLFQYTAIDEYSRDRYLGAFKEQSTYSSAVFLEKVYKYFKRKGIRVECVQTDNGFEFTSRFSPSKRHLVSFFEKRAAELGIKHKLIRPYTPRHNGKVERSHREDQRCFYDSHVFYSFADFEKQLAKYQSTSNNRPMRPLGYLSPNEFLRCYSLQYV